MTRRMKLTPHGTQSLQAYWSDVEREWSQAKTQATKLTALLKSLKRELPDWSVRYLPKTIKEIATGFAEFDGHLRQVASNPELSGVGVNLLGYVEMRVKQALNFEYSEHPSSQQIGPLVNALLKSLAETAEAGRMYNRNRGNRTMTGSGVLLPLVMDLARMSDLFGRFRYQPKVEHWFERAFFQARFNYNVVSNDIDRKIDDAQAALETGDVREAKADLAGAALKIMSLATVLNKLAKHMPPQDDLPTIQADVLQWSRRWEAMAKRTYAALTKIRA